jgi:hypothetical protein
MMKHQTPTAKWLEKEAIAVAWLTEHLDPSVEKLHSTAYLGIGRKPRR